MAICDRRSAMRTTVPYPGTSRGCGPLPRGAERRLRCARRSRSEPECPSGMDPPRQCRGTIPVVAVNGEGVVSVAAAETRSGLDERCGRAGDGTSVTQRGADGAGAAWSAWWRGAPRRSMATTAMDGFGKVMSPLAERLVGGDQQGALLVNVHRSVRTGRWSRPDPW